MRIFLSELFALSSSSGDSGDKRERRIVANGRLGLVVYDGRRRRRGVKDLVSSHATNYSSLPSHPAAHAL